MESLSGGYIYCEEYLPGELDNKYNEKKGVIIKKGKSYEMYIHPDDVTKIQNIDIDDTFMCVGYQFQYLILERNGVRIRVLSNNFELL